MKQGPNLLAVQRSYLLLPGLWGLYRSCGVARDQSLGNSLLEGFAKCAVDV